MSDAMEVFRDFLRVGLVDPANRGGKWIFDNYPRKDFGKDPIISIIGADKKSKPMALGNTSWQSTTMIQVDIWVRDDVGYSINNEKVFDKDLCEKIADDLEEYVRKNWVSSGILLLELTDRTPLVFDLERVLWRIILTYEVVTIDYNY